MKVAVLGGSGKLGQGFAARLARTTHEYVIGSRDPAKGRPNNEAARWCDAAVVAVPYHGHRALLEPLGEALTGKIVIDATVPLDPSNPLRLKTEFGSSATEEAASFLKRSAVFAAFQTVSHRVLQHVDHTHDVLVAGPTERKSEVLELIRNMNLRPIDAGPLPIAGILESLTVLLISINKRNKVKESGIEITGLA
ncbi:MAG: NADPH-dependent F420 reductase [Acidobacteria bacterium]|nr:NADPH-dependent F420 reductase [Acidobacteriota bacterium]